MMIVAFNIPEGEKSICFSANSKSNESKNIHKVEFWKKKKVYAVKFIAKRI